jgi:hypothetical protein
LGVAEGLSRTFLDNVLRRKPTRDWLAIYKQAFAQIAKAERAKVSDYSNPPASPALAAETSAYLGSYKNDFFGQIDIIAKNGELILVLGPKKMTFPMTQWNRDTFTYVTKGENAVGTAGITFTMAPMARPNVLIENLNIHDEGSSSA